MTDRLGALTVVLKDNIREDDAEGLINAIKQLRGVLSVKGHVTDIETHIAEDRVRHELGQKLIKLVYPKS
ncbi:MAG: hypothetical protein V3U54_08495 [Thermodesulfobacteriota bacterium]